MTAPSTTTTIYMQQKQLQHQQQQQQQQQILQREERQQPPLFRPRLSAEDLKALLDSASETHQKYRNGSLLRSSSSSSSLNKSRSTLQTESTKASIISPISARRSASFSSLPITQLLPQAVTSSIPPKMVISATPPLPPLSQIARASTCPAPFHNSRNPKSTTTTTNRTTTNGDVDTDIKNDKNNTGHRLALRLQNKILDSVTVNRLTIIVGATGSGKSTQVPPLLLNLKEGAVLCTQPRRLAVVAIAKRVSSELKVELGGDKVGYHVGNCNLSTQKTQLLFTTAGILLEELRANGSDALKRFRVLIIDECHERSPESDLILSLVKVYLQKHPKSQLRVVLMSATFAHNRYKDYFKSVPGCQTVDTIALESASQAFSTAVETFYLEDILQRLPSSHSDFGRQMRLNPDKDLQSKVLSHNMLQLISSLVSWLDSTEVPLAPFLIFAPTYRHLEQLHDLLLSDDFHISVLHSSIDMDDCLRSMQGTPASSDTSSKTGKRRILLASAIADSSVTVPGVTCVIDMCRSLEVQWTSSDHVARTIWASKSICDQRRGRTGRTCPGRCFRLLHKGFYLSQRLTQWDVPQLTLSSCLNEVLGLVCSKPHDLVDAYDPQQLLQKCLDPPNEQVVENAIKYLQEMGAVELKAHSKKKKKMSLSSLSLPPATETSKVMPTNYGEILAALPLNVSDAKIVLAGGQMGLLHETLALRAIYNHKPAPIVHKFGSPQDNMEVLESFYCKATSHSGCYLAHLAAYMFWDYEWNCKRRKKANREFWERSEESVGNTNAEWESLNVWKWTAELEEDHIAWCKDHDINPTAVRSISEIVVNTMNALFLSKFEPAWLRCADPTPLWKRPRDWHGTVGEGRDMLHRVYDNVSMLCNVLMALLENRLSAASTLVNQMLCLETSSSRMVCIHFLQGNCIYGDRCRDSHHPQATRPICRFGKLCSKGKECLYSHKNDNDDESSNGFPTIEGGEMLLTAKLPLLLDLTVVGGPAAWFQHHHQRMLMLGEGDFKFAAALSQLGSPSFLSSTNASASNDTTVMGTLSNVDATRLHVDDRILCQLGRLDTFAWNFPYISGHDEDPIIHEALLLETFHSLALMLANCEFLEFFTFAVALQADQFSRWNVIQCAWKTGWRLQSWSTFDHTAFPGYFPSRHAGESFPVEEARLYIFMLNKCDVGARVAPHHTPPVMAPFVAPADDENEPVSMEP